MTVVGGHGRGTLGTRGVLSVGRLLSALQEPPFPCPRWGGRATRCGQQDVCGWVRQLLGQALLPPLPCGEVAGAGLRPSVLSPEREGHVCLLYASVLCGLFVVVVYSVSCLMNLTITLLRLQPLNSVHRSGVKQLWNDNYFQLVL